MQTEENYDFLTIYDGFAGCDTSDVVLHHSGNLTGLRRTLTTIGNNLSVNFLSDHSGVERGFSLRIYYEVIRTIIKFIMALFYIVKFLCDVLNQLYFYKKYLDETLTGKFELVQPSFIKKTYFVLFSWSNMSMYFICLGKSTYGKHIELCILLHRMSVFNR